MKYLNHKIEIGSLVRYKNKPHYGIGVIVATGASQGGSYPSPRLFYRIRLQTTNEEVDWIVENVEEVA